MGSILALIYCWSIALVNWHIVSDVKLRRRLTGIAFICGVINIPCIIYTYFIK